MTLKLQIMFFIETMQQENEKSCLKGIQRLRGGGGGGTIFGNAQKIYLHEAVP